MQLAPPYASNIESENALCEETGPVHEGAAVVVMPRTSPPTFVVVTGGDAVHAFGGHGG